MIALDRRVHDACLLLVVGLAGHGAELIAADPPWRPSDAVWVSPGWHRCGLTTGFGLVVAALWGYAALPIAALLGRPLSGPATASP